jgi:hypothetical protein
MAQHFKRALAACSVLSLSVLAAQASEERACDQPASATYETSTPPGLPTVGKWMIARDGSPAQWLGEIVDGKHLHEPINVILIDAVSASPEDARANLLASATKAGYPIRFGHSAGYRGFIGGTIYCQLPNRRDDAFSNHIFEESNNHGRIFGPHQFDGAYLFIGAFSRESVNFLRDPPHRYASFNQARNGFADALTTHTSFRPRGMVPLDNAILANPRFTTGDHDGNAVVLKMEK